MKIEALKVLFLSSVLAILMIVIGIGGAHLWNDHAQLHAIIGVLNVNITKGRLEVPQVEAAPPAPAPPKAEEPKK